MNDGRDSRGVKRGEKQCTVFQEQNLIDTGGNFVTEVLNYSQGCFCKVNVWVSVQTEKSLRLKRRITLSNRLHLLLNNHNPKANLQPFQLDPQQARCGIKFRRNKKHDYQVWTFVIALTCKELENHHLILPIRKNN